MTERDIEDLKESTRRTDRIESEEAEEESDSEVEYTPIDEVVLRKNAEEDVSGLKEQTQRRDRIHTIDDEEVNLQPFEALDFEGEMYESVEEPYCGNCEFVTFRKHNGKPEPHCTEWGAKTRLDPGMVCSDYVPQGHVDGDD